MFVHMWEPWEWVSGVDVFSPPESSSKLALAHRASGTEVYTTQTSERYHRGMSMRNVEFPELEHAKAQAEEERERVCRFEKPLSVAHTAWSVRLHGVVQSSTGLEVDDDRRKSLAEKGWARRSLVVRSVGPSGAADFEAVPGREEYGAGEDGAAEWKGNKGWKGRNKKRKKRCWGGVEKKRESGVKALLPFRASRAKSVI